MDSRYRQFFRHARKSIRRVSCLKKKIGLANEKTIGKGKATSCCQKESKKVITKKKEIN